MPGLVKERFPLIKNGQQQADESGEESKGQWEEITEMRNSTMYTGNQRQMCVADTAFETGMVRNEVQRTVRGLYGRPYKPNWCTTHGESKVHGPRNPVGLFMPHSQCCTDLTDGSWASTDIC